MRIAAAAVALLCTLTAIPAVAQVKSGAAVKWGPGPAFLPRGAKLAVLEGDPGASGVYTLRLRLPNGYTIKSHFHPTDEHITVLSGTFLVGMGDTVKARATQRLTAGGFITAPKDAHHYALARGVTIIQVHGEGPFQITYVKPADDPRSAPPK